MLDYFTWNGVRSHDDPSFLVDPYGVHALIMPSIVSPGEKFDSIEIPGRSGSLTLPQGIDIFSNLQISTSCVIDDPNDLDDYNPVTQQGLVFKRLSNVITWLRGRGKVSFPNRPGGFYYGIIESQMSFDRILRDNPHRRFGVSWNCEPFFYLNSGDSEVTVSETGQTFTNQGNITSLPLIHFAFGSATSGTNTIDIQINSQDPFSITFPEGIKHFYIDCKDMRVYSRTNLTTDPPILRGMFASGDWPKFEVGTNRIYYAITSESFSEDYSILVTPRWRCI